MGLAVTEAAKDPGVSRETLSSIINGKACISPEIAVRLSIAFNTFPESWVNQQSQYDYGRQSSIEMNFMRQNYLRHKMMNERRQLWGGSFWRSQISAECGVRRMKKYTSMTEQTKIILVRHGETEWNQQGRLQGHQNSSLTKNGELQALETKKALSSYEIHRAYVSPLQRAQETMGIILSDRKLTAIKSNNLKEICLGPWEGKTKEETKKSHPMEYDLFWNKQHKFLLSGAETYQQLQERMVSELKQIFEKETHKTILVVTHWIAIKVVMAYFTSTPLNQLSSLPDLGNGKFLILLKEGEQISVGGV